MSVALDDFNHVWHPCSPLNLDRLNPLVIKRAEGSYVELNDGRKIIDAISSWWCKSLGHQHPRLKKALLDQLERFEHVIFANTTHELMIELSKKLTGLGSTFDKVFYAGDGSCAVEIALKMSLHARKICNENKRIHFIALKHGYHGETVGAMSVSDVDPYLKHYRSLLFPVHYIDHIPYVLSKEDPLWSNCEAHWTQIEVQLEMFTDTATALIVEPIVQGAGGMKIYSQDFLRRLRKWCDQHHVHLIADEIMTGMGRTAKMLACDHAQVEPDLLCLSKGLTAGWMPFSAVVISKKIANVFYENNQAEHLFLHSHTFCGHALSVSIALQVFALLEEENICHQAEVLGKQLLANMKIIEEETNRIKNIRQLGALVAADLKAPFDLHRAKFSQLAAQFGAIMRPLGSTIYWLPPLNTQPHTLEELKDITTQVLINLK